MFFVVQTLCAAGSGGVGGASTLHLHQRAGGDSGRRGRGGRGAAAQRRIEQDRETVNVTHETHLGKGGREFNQD